MSEPLRWPSGRRLFLMRHGETYEPHPDTLVPGRAENPQLPLTPRGRERLGEIARWMAKLPIEAAYASPYRRAQETAQIVVEPHGLPVATLDSIKDLEVHPPDGGTMGDVARRYLALIRELAEKGEHDVHLDCGRSLGDIVDTALAEIRDALERSRGPLLVVAHGGLNRFLLGRWLGMPALRAIAIEQNFACVNIVEFIGSGHPWVRSLNATFHDPFKLDAPGV
jgi:broad specificity phosphatase PhoE